MIIGPENATIEVLEQRVAALRTEHARCVATSARQGETRGCVDMTAYEAETQAAQDLEAAKNRLSEAKYAAWRAAEAVKEKQDRADRLRYRDLVDLFDATHDAAARTEAIAIGGRLGLNDQRLWLPVSGPVSQPADVAGVA